MTGESRSKKKKRRPRAAVTPDADTATGWEARVLAKIARRVEAVARPDDPAGQDGSQYGWEQRSLDRLAEHVRRKRRR